MEKSWENCAKSHGTHGKSWVSPGNFDGLLLISMESMEVINQRTSRVLSCVIKYGWNIPKLNGYFQLRKSSKYINSVAAKPCLVTGRYPELGTEKRRSSPTSVHHISP
jgi:hypothetical protein